jgi:hypothetical protein
MFMYTHILLVYNLLCFYITRAVFTNQTLFKPLFILWIGLTLSYSFFCVYFPFMLYLPCIKRWGTMLYYNIQIDPSWTYKQAVLNLKALRLQYEEVLTSFSSWQYREKSYFIHSTRDKFYALNCLEWQKDNLWKYMNGYLPYYVLKRSSIRYK